MKNIVRLFAFTFLLLSVFTRLQASNIRAAGEVHIDEPVNGNLYTAGGEVHQNALINGDFICAGGEIHINERIAKDAILTGAEIKIRGVIGEDLRLAGGEALVEADVMGDLVVTGGEVTVEEGVTIHGDVYIAGGKVEIAGTVLGEVKMIGGEMDFIGTAAGNFSAKGGDLHIDGVVKGRATLAAHHLRLGSNARFHSDVHYWQKDGKINFQPYVESGVTVIYDTNLKFADFDKRSFGFSILGFTIYRLLAASLIIVLMVFSFDRFFTRHSGAIQQNILHSLSYGTIYLVCLPIAIGLVCLTVIGIPLGMMAAGVYAVTLIGANALTAVVGAYELEKYTNKDWGRGTMIGISIGIFVLLKLIGFLWFPGKMALFVATAIAFGTVILWIRKERAGKHKTDEPAAESDMV